MYLLIIKRNYTMSKTGLNWTVAVLGTRLFVEKKIDTVIDFYFRTSDGITWMLLLCRILPVGDRRKKSFSTFGNRKNRCRHLESTLIFSFTKHPQYSAGPDWKKSRFFVVLLLRMLNTAPYRWGRNNESFANIVAVHNYYW